MQDFKPLSLCCLLFSLSLSQGACKAAFAAVTIAISTLIKAAIVSNSMSLSMTVGLNYFSNLRIEVLNQYVIGFLLLQPHLGKHLYWS